MRNILVVDSGPLLFEAIQHAVRDLMPQARIRSAQHGEPCMRELNQAKFELIILRDDGGADWEELRAIRESAVETPILIVLNPEHEALAPQAIEHGASDCVTNHGAFESILPLAMERCLEKAALQKRIRHFEREAQAAQAAQRARTEFMSRMTHDLRTPLVGLRIYAQFLASGRLGPLSPVQKEKVEAIYRNTERLTQCIERIQRYQRLEAAELELVPTDFDIRGVLNEAICGIMSKCMEKGISVGQSFPPESVPVHADRELMLETVKDLLDNAVNFTGEKGSISVNCVKTPDRRVSVSITDSGCGMSAEKQKCLFDTSKWGSALGLRMVKRILDAHQCEISIDSSLGGGTRMRFTLPPSQAAPEIPPHIGPELQTRRRVVLVVDDDEDNLSCTRSVLEYSGYDVLSAAGLDEARAQLETGHVDIMLLDIALRGADGLETLRQLKRSAATSSLPVVMFSAKADDSVRAKAAHIGAAGFVVKPFIPAKLLREIEGVLSAVHAY